MDMDNNQWEKRTLENSLWENSFPETLETLYELVQSGEKVFAKLPGHITKKVIPLFVVMGAAILSVVLLAAGAVAITNNQGQNLPGVAGDCSPRLEAALESRGGALGLGPVELQGFALHSPLRSAPLDMYVTDMKVKAADRVPRVEKCRFDRGAPALQARLGFREMIVSGKVEVVGEGREGRCNMTLRMRRPGLGVTVVPAVSGHARLGPARLNTAATFVDPQFVSVHAYGCKGNDRGRSVDDKEEVTEEMEDIFMRGVRSLITRYMEARLEPALKDSLMLSLGYTLSYGR